MKIFTAFTSLTLCLLANCLLAQSILKDYFNGNKDSMLAQANMLVQLPEPEFDPLATAPTGEEALPKRAYKTENRYFRARDGKTLFAYRFPQKSKHTIILLHGVKSTAKDYLRTAELLQKATKAEVFAVDLRGHGHSEGKPGDVDHIDQYADDVADIVEAIRREKHKGKIVLAGHSMGGGVALCHAMLAQQSAVDGYLLLAPLIGHDSPAIFQTPPGATASTEEPGMKIHIVRIIGLKMLEELGIHDFEHLPVLFFKVPKGEAIRVYSYRANRSMAPESYVAGLRAVTAPLLMLVGEKDEAFDAQALKKAILENSRGEAHVLPGLTHQGIAENDQICGHIQKWFNQL